MRYAIIKRTGPTHSLKVILPGAYTFAECNCPCPPPLCNSISNPAGSPMCLRALAVHLEGMEGFPLHLSRPGSRYITPLSSPLLHLYRVLHSTKNRRSSFRWGSHIKTILLLTFAARFNRTSLLFPDSCVSSFLLPPFPSRNSDRRINWPYYCALSNRNARVLAAQLRHPNRDTTIQYVHTCQPLGSRKGSLLGMQQSPTT